ncbi:DUF6194 family protein [Deinococcus aetherius]|nr:DUF6194 family protein [Deinococcus aetherius]
MTPNDVLVELGRLFPESSVIHADGDSYFMAKADQKMPFATLVTSDQHDAASNLNREGVYRLNLGVKRDTYITLFGAVPKPHTAWDVIDTGHNYAALDTLMPHPIYAPMGWICVLNPGAATFERLRPLLQEAYEKAGRHQ